MTDFIYGLNIVSAKQKEYFYLPPNKYSNAYERQYKNKEGCIVKYDNSTHPNCIKNKLYEYQEPPSGKNQDRIPHQQKNNFPQPECKTTLHEDTVRKKAGPE